MTRRAMRTIPPTWGAAMDSCISIRWLKPTFLLVKVMMTMAIDIKPRPPISMSVKITSCPKIDQWVNVS